jgi:hypothetical protein
MNDCESTARQGDVVEDSSEVEMTPVEVVEGMEQGHSDNNNAQMMIEYLNEMRRRYHGETEDGEDDDEDEEEDFDDESVTVSGATEGADADNEDDSGEFTCEETLDSSSGLSSPSSRSR